VSTPFVADVARKAVTMAFVSFFCLWACADGSPCATGSDCASGYCSGFDGADPGICCDRACDGECETCSGSGKCEARTGDCGSVQGVCGGQCDGVHGACSYPGVLVQCSGPSCNAATSTATPAGFCDGAGTCKTPANVSCAPGACGATACTTCTVNGDCGSGKHCEGGICSDNLGLGTACATGSECTSGICVDDVCCNVACNGECEACDVAGKAGTCSPVSGAVHGGRVACGGVVAFSPCAGACDGVNRNACKYPGSGTECVVDVSDCSQNPCICINNKNDTCDGKGSCFAPPDIRCPNSGTGGSTTTTTTDTSETGGSSSTLGTGGSTSSATSTLSGSSPSTTTSSTSGTSESGGCGCRTAGESDPESAAWLVALGAVVLASRRRRRD
jgi:MYXO-CTERM domain-containing protein